MVEYTYYSRAVIRLNNLKHNLNVIRSLIKKNTKILIPVKCNAYGFGALPVSQFLEKEKVDYLGVAFPFEGVYLRTNKIKLPILVFSEIVYPRDYENIIKYHLTPTVFTDVSLHRLNECAQKMNTILSIHIKIDTGMGRNGIDYQHAYEFIYRALQKRNLRIEGIYTHLSSAEEKKCDFTKMQLARFDHIIKKLTEDNIHIPFIHVFNSAGIMHYPNYSYTMVRPGIMFYGYYPDNHIIKRIHLKQGMTVQSKIAYMKHTEKSTPISYGHTYYTKKKEKIATVSCGYGDGINRLLSNQHQVLYHNQLCSIRGRICMDQFMIDVSHIKKAQQGDWVTIFGPDKKKEIRLETIANTLHTISYEIICNMGSRVERIYIP